MLHDPKTKPILWLSYFFTLKVDFLVTSNVDRDFHAHQNPLQQFHNTKSEEFLKEKV